MTKQIDIKELIPFMKDGWVAMDKSGEWYWYDATPELLTEKWICGQRGNVLEMLPFNIVPAEDWTKSLIKVENDNAR